MELFESTLISLFVMTLKHFASKSNFLISRTYIN